MSELKISLVSVVVRNYDEAIAFYVGKLGFDLIEDRVLAPGKRWVVVRPMGARETGLLLAEAKNDDERSCIGNQTGGRVFLFLETDDFARDYEKFSANGVHFKEQPRHEPYGSVAVFEDVCGNLWDLIERKF
jgi:catechol 2,3-dioxygenase-like lactoylglutathione lyase family enzyme